MTDANVLTPAPRNRRGWLRTLIWVFGILVVLLVVAYFVGTSSAFFKGVILPKAGAAINASVTVSDASISPFKEVVLHNLKVQTTGTEPLLKAPEVRLRYNLGDIIRGNLFVDEMALSSPSVVLVQNPDGTSNLDPILKSFKAQPQKPKAPAKPSKPLQIDIRKIALTDGTIRQLKLYGGNHQDTSEISHVNLNVTDLKNGQTGKLTLAADINVDNNPPEPSTKAALNAKANANFSIALAPDLKPASIQGTAGLSVTRADGALAQLAALGASLDCNVTPTEVKQVALRFTRGDIRLGEIHVTGPFDMDKTEGRLSVEVLNIDKNLLNLVGASSGTDFGPTTLSSSNMIHLANAGSAISAAGQLSLSQLQLTRTNQTTPALELRAQYDVSVDRTASNAVLRAFTLKGSQKGSSILTGELTSPMTLAWGNTANAVGDSALTLAVTRLDLADWKAFLGDVAPAGLANVKLQLVSSQGGKNLTFDLNSEVSNMTAGHGSDQITQATVTLLVRGQATDLKQFNFREYKLQLLRANQPLVTASGSGIYGQPSGTADFQLDAQLVLAPLLQAFPQPDVKVSSGTADVKMHVVQKPQSSTADARSPAATQAVTGSFALADFTAKVGNNNFHNFGLNADLDVSANPQQVLIRKLNGKITERQSAGGAFDISGNCWLTNKASQLTAKLVNFNQTGLRPFLEPALGNKKLMTVALNASSSVQYDPLGASAVKADLQVTNLVVNDPKGQFPSTPLAVGLILDLSLNRQVADVKQFQLALTPTSRGSNVVQLTGHVDMSQTNAIQGNLKLAADSLDLTTYYDLFGGQNKSLEKPGTPSVVQAKPAAGVSATEKEPEPQQLPLRNFTAEASIRRAYLREVEVADFQASTKLDGGHLVLNPFKLSLNGAPVSSTIDADLGVPGYKYALSFNAQALPLAPLVNSFQPDRKGQVGGTLTAQVQVKGAGITGANLQKNLTGQFDIGSTNLNLAVVNVRSPLLRTLINVVALLPDLIKNPESGFGSLVQELTGKSSGGLADDLSRSPVDVITARGTSGEGRIGLQQAVVQSSAFRAEATGTVSLAPILTNSAIQTPVSVYLSRPIAQRLNLADTNTPTSTQYVKLPDFLTMKGTVGKPDPAINKLALASVALQGIGGAFQGGGKASNLLQGLLGAAASSGTATNAAPNQPATNPYPIGNLLNQFLKPKK